MSLVADTNIFLAVALGEAQRVAIVQQTMGALLVAPEILPYEIGNALSAMVKRRQLTASEALQAHAAIDGIPVRLVSVDIQASLKIALEHKIYAYDAYFLQCARMFSWPLVSLDQRLLQVARQMDLDVVEIAQ